MVRTQEKFSGKEESCPGALAFGSSKKSEIGQNGFAAPGPQTRIRYCAEQETDQGALPRSKKNQRGRSEIGWRRQLKPIGEVLNAKQRTGKT
jgi:hypothetical protein